ncbi:MAG: ABC transporter permease [Propionibacteriaceae bacterium]|jgi:ABC-2 type transport system permease protein|nr:ABC transporter permease [Propionibacteriaceae bacterium]
MAVPYQTVRSSVPARLTVPRVIRSEFLKFFSLRSSWWVMIVFFALSTVFCLILSLAAGSLSGATFDGNGDPAPIDPSDIIKQLNLIDLISMPVTVLGTLIISILGVLVITNEYSSGLIRSTFTAVPRRLPVILGKVVVLIAGGASITYAAMLLSYLIGRIILAPHGINLTLISGPAGRIFVGVPLVVVTFALMGLMIGCLIRSTAGSIATTVGLTFVLPALADTFRGLLVMGQDSVSGWRKIVVYLLDLLPTSASNRLLAFDPVSPEAAGLYYSPWAGYGILCLWLLAFAVAGLLRLMRSDA